MRLLRPAVLSLVLLSLACGRREEPPRPDAPAVAAATLLAADVPTPEPPPAPPPEPRPLAGKKVLHVGDSMVGGQFGLTRALEAKLTRAGATLVRHTQVSATLTSFDHAPLLRDLLRAHEPDIVILTLGTNDTTVPFPRTFAPHVANIVRRLGDRECWWIGPPSWKGADTGLVSVLRENAGTCRFFDSTKLELERTSDGIHPSDRGAARWADAFWPVFSSLEASPQTPPRSASASRERGP